MTPQAFGTKPPWNKDKNGKSWYRDCRLAAGYAPQRLLLASSRLRALGLAPKSGEQLHLRVLSPAST
jgi:hypothetical protein